MNPASEPTCEACDAYGSWLVPVRIPTGETVKVCPTCVRRIETLTAASFDRADPRHPDNVRRETPKETRQSFAYAGGSMRLELTSRFYQLDHVKLGHQRGAALAATRQPSERAIDHKSRPPLMRQGNRMR